MKLATYQNDTKDGQLMVVSHDLSKTVAVPDISTTLQFALDNWKEVSPKLQEIYHLLNIGEIKNSIVFNEHQCHSPLPRAYQWADGSAYVNHIELVRKARNAEMPDSFWTDPLIYQGGSDNFIPPKAPIMISNEQFGIDFESEIAVITLDVPMGISADEAHHYIALVMLVNDVSLRNLIPPELNKGFGFFHSKPSSAFSPVAVTIDELQQYWRDGKVHLPLITHLNETLFGQPNAGVDMTFNFPTLIAHAAKTRPLAAGTIIGSGTVSNYDRSVGSSCLAEKRMLEIIEYGTPKTHFMRFGDKVKIEMFDGEQSIFGSIEQEVKEYH